MRFGNTCHITPLCVSCHLHPSSHKVCAFLGLADIVHRICGGPRAALSDGRSWLACVLETLCLVEVKNASKDKFQLRLAPQFGPHFGPRRALGLDFAWYTAPHMARAVTYEVTRMLRPASGLTLISISTSYRPSVLRPARFNSTKANRDILFM